MARVLGRCIGVILWASACLGFVFWKSPELRVVSLARVLEQGEITVITSNNANCYYHYRGEPMGFEFELARDFAAALGVRLRVQIADRWQGMVPAVHEANGQAFIAASLVGTDTRARQAALSRPYLTVYPLLILPRSDQRIRTPEDLAGCLVHVRRASTYQKLLETLQRRGIDVGIVLHEDIPTEELIRMVADGEIPATVADSHIAKLNRRYYPEARIGPVIGPPQRLVWAVHPDAVQLLARIDLFFARISAEGRLQQLYERYFNALDEFDYLDLRAFHRRIETRLPRYKGLIRAAADANHIDWRLIAAQIYQESHWDPQARSHAGAYGLMQLTEATARSLGVGNILDPEENIRAGVRYLKNLYAFFDQARGQDRLFLALAAYNWGMGNLESRPGGLQRRAGSSAGRPQPCPKPGAGSQSVGIHAPDPAAAAKP